MDKEDADEVMQDQFTSTAGALQRATCSECVVVFAVPPYGNDAADNLEVVFTAAYRDNMTPKEMAEMTLNAVSNGLSDMLSQFGLRMAIYDNDGNRIYGNHTITEFHPTPGDTNGKRN